MDLSKPISAFAFIGNGFFVLKGGVDGFVKKRESQRDLGQTLSFRLRFSSYALLLPPPLFAQGKHATDEDKSPDTVKVNVSGNVTAQPVFRSGSLNAINSSDPVGPESILGTRWLGEPPRVNQPEESIWNPKDVVSVESTTNPKTGIRVEVVKFQDGTTTVTQFDKDGIVIGRTTHGPKADLSKFDVSKIIYAHHSRQWGGGSVPNKYKWPKAFGGGGPVGGNPVGGDPGGGGSSQGPGGGPVGGSGEPPNPPHPGQVPEGQIWGWTPEQGEAWWDGKETHVGHPPWADDDQVSQPAPHQDEGMEVVEVEPMAPTSGADWNFLPEPDLTDPNNPYSLGGVNEPVPQNVDIMEVTKQDPAVSHVAFDSGRGEVVVVMKDGITMTPDAYLKSPGTQVSGKSEGGTPIAPADYFQFGSVEPSSIGLGTAFNVSGTYWTNNAIQLGIRMEYLSGDEVVNSNSNAPVFEPAWNIFDSPMDFQFTVAPEPVSTNDLKRMSKRIGKALDGYLKEGIKNPFQSSAERLEFDGLLGKWSGSGSRANLGDLFQGDTFGGAGHSTSSGGSSCE